MNEPLPRVPGITAHVARLMATIAIDNGRNDAAARQLRILRMRDLPRAAAAAERDALDAQRETAERTLHGLIDALPPPAARESWVDAVERAVSWRGETWQANTAFALLCEQLHDHYGLDVIDERVSIAPQFDADAADNDAEHTIREATAGAVARHAGSALGADAATTADPQGHTAVPGPVADWIDAYLTADDAAAALPGLRNRLLDGLADTGLGEIDRARLLFIVDYLAGSPTASTFDCGPMVAVDDSVKNRVDTLLARYQRQLQRRIPLDDTGTQLADAVQLLGDHDRDTAYRRAFAIADNPQAEQTALWPDYVDRAHLVDQLRDYARVVERFEQYAVAADQGTRARTEARKLLATMGELRRSIDTAIGERVGLSDLERDRVRVTLLALDHGHNAVPGLLLADDASSRAHDRQQSAAAALTTVGELMDAVTKILEPVTSPTDKQVVANSLDPLRRTLITTAVGTPVEDDAVRFERGLLKLSHTLTQVKVDSTAASRAVAAVAFGGLIAVNMGIEARDRDQRWAGKLQPAAQLHRGTKAAETDATNTRGGPAPPRAERPHDAGQPKSPPPSNSLPESGRDGAGAADERQITSPNQDFPGSLDDALNQADAKPPPPASPPTPPHGPDIGPGIGG